MKDLIYQEMSREESSLDWRITAGVMSDKVLMRTLEESQSSGEKHAVIARVENGELKEAYVPAVKGDMNYHRADFDDESIKWELLEGGVDYELVDGVTLLSVTGHTAGTQNVLVRTSEGPVIYASDSVYWYRNWNENRIPGICYSVPEWLNAVAKMKAIYGVTMIPGHEPSIDMTRVYGR